MKSKRQFTLITEIRCKKTPEVKQNVNDQQNKN